MRLVLALALSVALCASAVAAECTLASARYSQPDAAWLLTFQRVPKYGAANQIAAFSLELSNSGATLDGAVHSSNGFGYPHWSVEGRCGPDSEEICSVLMENQSPAIYGIYDGVVRFLDAEHGVVAPEQIIMPQLAASLWYSSYRNSEWFGDEVTPGDAFVLQGCD